MPSLCFRSIDRPDPIIGDPRGPRVARLGLQCTLLAALSAGSFGALAAEHTDAPRFRLDAALRPLAVSACGRFALDAEARFAPEAKSADGRFALKAVHVPAGGCDPFPDPIFADGFESP